ncbi:unnamed protein product [Miscanthus lutarioriparius]|uniref:ABC-2 type transporter transmembrane domain-containing protein n=1 Tax=Miscanthus lutarioriparius TaxID=422564 RepID=A0A811Q2S1_9POAL|nr:unnamed protein product [Miscanthus lutarioriparius]
MVATSSSSSLPRWAPTPSPSQTLWRWGGGGVVFAWGGRRHRGTASSDGAAAAERACVVVVPRSGCELQVVVPSSTGEDGGDPRAFLTWEDVRVSAAGGGGPRGAPDRLQKIQKLQQKQLQSLAMLPSRTNFALTPLLPMDPTPFSDHALKISTDSVRTDCGHEFFTLNGFPCPHLRSPSDHFLRTINKDFDEETVESSTANRKTAAEAIDILATAYRSSNYLEKTTEQIVEMKNMDGASFRRREQASFATKLLVLTRRSFLNMHRDIGYYWMRLAIYMGIGICLGTIFYQVGYSYSSIQSRCSVIMYTVALLTFMSIGGFPSFVEDVKVFRKERLSGHYGVSEFVISNTLLATPYLSVIAVLPGAMLYYLTGLTKGVDHFTYFVMVVCICCLLVESMMMVIAAIVPDFLMGIIIGAGVQGVMMQNGGFFRLPNELPKAIWKYPCYYMSFHKYAVQGLYKNEFMGLSFPSDQLIESNVTISGIQVLKVKLQVELGYSKWVDLAIVCGMMVTYRMIFFTIVKIAEEIRQKMGGKRGCVR